MYNFYWDKFYKKNKTITQPSSFAKFVEKKFIKKKAGNLLEIGCGNARDTLFLNKNNLNIIAIDKSKIVIKKNILKKKEFGLKNITFFRIDAGSKKIKKIGKFEFIYSRFFLHTINEDTENYLINNLIKISKLGCILMFEFRTIKDELFRKGSILSSNERYTDHYRRFVDKNVILKKIAKLKKFKIIYIKEAKNFAKYKKENPIVCRLILIRFKK